MVTRFFLCYFLIMCMCVSICGYVFMHAGAYRVQKRALKPQELESQAVVNYTMGSGIQT